jgi:hypothetical protein
VHPKWAVVALLFVARTAHADAVEDARKDYEAGAAAYDRHDWVTAASRFSRADERVPNPRALQLAMASATHLTDAPLAMSLVERAEQRAVDGTLAELAKRLRARFAKEVGHVRVVCAAKCEASVNGRPGLSHWLTPGSYRVKFETGEKEISVAAGADIDVSPPPAPPAPPPVEDKPIESAVVPRPLPSAESPSPRPLPPERHGLRPWIFWTGVGATAAGGATSGVLTVLSKSAHDDFIAMPNEMTAAEGEAAQTRAVVAWSVTGALLVATVVIAILTDFE